MMVFGRDIQPYAVILQYSYLDAGQIRREAEWFHRDGDKEM